MCCLPVGCHACMHMKFGGPRGADSHIQRELQGQHACGQARRANVDENARTTIGAKTMIPLRNIAAWPSRSRYFVADLLDANETRSPTSDLSDESIADTFVSVRMELPAHSHAAQPIRKPDGGMRSGRGRTRVGHDVGLPARRHCRPRRSLDRTRERMPRSTLLSTSRCGRRRYRHFGVADTIV